MPPKKEKRPSSPREIAGNILTAAAKKVSPRKKEDASLALDYDSDNEAEPVNRDEIPIELRRSSTSSGQSGSLGPSPRSPGKSTQALPVSPSSPLRRNSQTAASSPILSSSPTNKLPDSFKLISGDDIPVRVSPPLPSNSSEESIKGVKEVPEPCDEKPQSPRFIDETLPKFFLSFDTFSTLIEAYRPKLAANFLMFTPAQDSHRPDIISVYQNCVVALKILFNEHINVVLVLNNIIQSEEDYRLLRDYFRAAIKSVFDVSPVKAQGNLFENTFAQFEQQSLILQGLSFSSQDNPMGLSQECLMQARRRLQLMRFYEVNFNGSRLTQLLASLREQLQLQNLFSTYQKHIEMFIITLGQKIQLDYHHHHHQHLAEITESGILKHQLPH